MDQVFALEEKIVSDVDLAIAAVSQLRTEKNVRFMRDVAGALVRTFRAGGKVILAGNGGSLCDAAHFAEECTGFFSKNRRRPLPAIALTEPGHITCTANDVGYEWVFARGVEAYGREGDFFIGLSTSGNSESIIKALDVAKALGLTTCSFLGKDGGRMLGAADYEMVIEGFSTSDRVQEAHMAAMHIIIGLVEAELFQPLEVNESLLQNYIERKKGPPL